MKSSQLGADVLYDCFSFCSQMSDITLQILDLLPTFPFLLPAPHTSEASSF